MAAGNVSRQEVWGFSGKSKDSFRFRDHQGSRLGTSCCCCCCCCCSSLLCCCFWWSSINKHKLWFTKERLHINLSRSESEDALFSCGRLASNDFLTQNRHPQHFAHYYCENSGYEGGLWIGGFCPKNDDLFGRSQNFNGSISCQQVHASCQQ